MHTITINYSTRLFNLTGQYFTFQYTYNQLYAFYYMQLGLANYVKQSDQEPLPFNAIIEHFHLNGCALSHLLMLFVLVFQLSFNMVYYFAFFPLTSIDNRLTICYLYSFVINSENVFCLSIYLLSGHKRHSINIKITGLSTAIVA